MADSLRSLFYYSEPSAPVGAEELSSLLERARFKNRELGITGLLLYTGQRFLQVLEGPHEAVAVIYESIQADRRHHSVVTLFDQDILDRSFPEWSMGYRLVDADEFRGFSLEDLNQLCVEKSSVVLALMQSLAGTQSDSLSYQS